MKAFQWNHGKTVSARPACCCGNDAEHEAAEGPEKTERVLVLGSGCAKCNLLEAATKSALAELGMQLTVGHVTDFSKIAAYGVMSTPALVVDGKVLISGRVPRKEELKKLLSQITE